MAGTQWVTLYWQMFHKMEEPQKTIVLQAHVPSYFFTRASCLFFKNCLCHRKKGHFKVGSPEKLWPFTTLGVSSHQQKFDCNQAACWALALFGGAEEWMDEATRGNWGEKFLRIWMDYFPGFCDLCSVYCNGVPWWLVDYFLFIFFHSWDNCFWTLSNWIPPILTTDEVLLAKMNPGFKNSCF